MPTILTRGQIKSQAVRRAFPVGLGLPEGSHPDPFLVNEELDYACDEIMGVLGEAFLQFDMDVAEGQSLYCFPPLTQLVGAQANPPTSVSPTSYRLRIFTVEDLLRVVPGLYIDGAVGSPAYAATQGQTNVLLYPTPSWTQAAGLTVYGISRLDNGAWAADSAACPLPAVQHQCVVWALAYRIAPMGSPQKAQAWAQYANAKGSLEAEMSDLVNEARSRAPGVGGRRGGLCGPLEM